MILEIAISALLSMHAALDVPPANTCKLAVYSVDDAGQRSAQIVSPADVESVVGNDGAADSPWRVTLTDAGAAKTAAFTKTHVGKVMAVTCDDKEVERASIHGEFSRTFVVIPHVPT